MTYGRDVTVPNTPVTYGRDVPVLQADAIRQRCVSATQARDMAEIWQCLNG